jgi:nitric oxide synthase-interacting protein
MHAALTLSLFIHVLQAFWVPSQAPEAKDLMAKPDTATYCPASGKKLRLKDCMAVKFTQVRPAAVQLTSS